MTADVLDRLLRTLRRQLALIHVVRIAAVVAIVFAIHFASRLHAPWDRRVTLVVMLAAVLAWVLLVIHSLRLGREVEAAGALLTTNRLDDAEIWLRRAIERFSLSVHAKIIACQQLASLLARRGAHEHVVAVCRELLQHRIRRVGNAWTNSRLMLTDSLLRLDRVDEAYEALRPLYEAPLSLADRMKLLPIQLRYELASDHATSAVRALPEKVRVAELLEPPRAALVHALLAEACRREQMPAQRDFFAERARLYHDLEPIAQREPAIAAIAAQGAEPT